MLLMKKMKKMMKMMRIYNKPDYKKAEQEAYRLLKMNNITEIPIKVKKLAKPFPNLEIKSYSWYAKKWKLTFDEVCQLADSDEGCCWYEEYTNQYMILYNDKIENKRRIRWTIAHELGHFMLKHNENNNKAILSRSSLTDSEYVVLEKEANCFARSLLAPLPIIERLNPSNPLLISKLFEISNEAAINVYKFFKTGYQRGRRFTNTIIDSLFTNFITRYKYGKTCTQCLHFFIEKDAYFCPICGNSNLLKGEGGNMIYSTIELNEKNMPHQCPRCKNEIIIGDYCQVCGVYLVNKCTGLSEGESDLYPFRITWHTHEKGCGIPLDGQARFCHICGSTSTYYEVGLLNYWKDEKNMIEQQEYLFEDLNEKQLVTAGGVVEISDEDLPF
jgi:IrrE N-terminal-like domain